MPEHLRALVVILGIAIVVFAFARLPASAVAPAPVPAPAGAPRQVVQPSAQQQPRNAPSVAGAIQWTQVRSRDSDSDLFVSFANPASKLRSGELVKMWAMYEFKEAQSNDGVPFLSAMAQNEYDCKEERWRVLAYIRFSGNMGEGRRVTSNFDMHNEWEPIKRWSIDETLWEIACGRW